MSKSLIPILALSTLLPSPALGATIITEKQINQNDGLFESNISPAILNNQRFTGSGITERLFIASLSPAGTNSDLVQLYTEPNITDITTYTVRAGDTLDSIARNFKVSRNTIRWHNEIKRGDLIKPGMQLIILPVSGVLHTVQKGDTIAKIAKKYNGEVSDISQFNDISSDRELVIGAKIIIPNGEKQDPASVAKPKTVLEKVTNIISKPFTRGKWNTREMIVNGYMHPTKFNGTKTQGYHHEWRAVDVGLPIGEPVYASMDGKVKIANKSGFGGGYGHYVYIEHSNGSGTMYAHLQKVSVSAGQRVGQGDQIGTSGNTGRSTGPHLHFEIRPPRGKSVRNWFPIPW